MTDRRRLLAGAADSELVRRCLVLQVRHAVDAQIDFIQIRERDLEVSALIALVSQAVAMARGTRTRVVVNDRLDVALACGADGVHLRADSVPPAAARSIAPRGFVVGRSVHGAEEAIGVAAEVDYLIAGTVWPSASKPADHPLLGTSGLAEVVRAVGVPVLAIGGVTLERIARVAASGAAGVAAIGLFMAPDSAAAGVCRAIPLRDAAEAARTRFDTSGSAS